MRNKILFFILLTFCLGLSAQHRMANTAVTEQTGKKVSKLLKTNHRMLNPISPPGVYIADPEARQMPDGRVYVYGSRDEPTNVWCSHTYDVLSTSDLINWDVEQFSFATKGIGKQVDYTDQLLYAPDCIYHNGKYYLYYCLTNEKEDEGVAVSSSPYGPFKEGKAIAGIHGIDPSVFIYSGDKPMPKELN